MPDPHGEEALAPEQAELSRGRRERCRETSAVSNHEADPARALRGDDKASSRDHPVRRNQLFTLCMTLVRKAFASIAA